MARKKTLDREMKLRLDPELDGRIDEALARQANEANGRLFKANFVRLLLDEALKARARKRRRQAVGA